jgi:hypothetical protein
MYFLKDESGLMARDKWHIETEGDRLTLSRLKAVRFDFSAKTMLPDASRRRVAHQIRQDMWRALQALRGFSPIVEITRENGHLRVKAGGQVEGGNFPRGKIENMVAELLEDVANRQRWLAFAAHRKAAL